MLHWGNVSTNLLPEKFFHRLIMFVPLNHFQEYQIFFFDGSSASQQSWICDFPHTISCICWQYSGQWWDLQYGVWTWGVWDLNYWISAFLYQSLNALRSMELHLYWIQLIPSWTQGFCFDWPLFEVGNVEFLTFSILSWYLHVLLNSRFCYLMNFYLTYSLPSF